MASSSSVAALVLLVKRHLRIEPEVIANIGAAHYLDQKRLRTGLYRHPWDDITYLMPSLAQGGGPPGNEGRVEVTL